MTVGMYLWSEPFVRRLPGSGEEVAVLLMDTQGLFDTVTNQTLTAHIFGLSTLISSYQIYNIKERVGEDALQHVALFSEYARIATGVASEEGKWVGGEGSSSGSGGGDNTPPTHTIAPPASVRELDRALVTSPRPRPPPVFQRLEFLVRDAHLSSPALWSGTMGGAEGEMGAYFRDLFDVAPGTSGRGGEDNRALRETRDHILDCFAHTSVYMLPHPGDEVAGNGDGPGPYDGAIGAIRDKFKHALGRYCECVFGEQLEAKVVAAGGVGRVGGWEATVGDFAHYVAGYAAVFEKAGEGGGAAGGSGGQLPSAMILIEATAQASNRSATDRALSHFHAALAEATQHFTRHIDRGVLEALGGPGGAAREGALAVFDARARFGPWERVAAARVALEGNLGEVLVDALERNKAATPPLAEWMLLLLLWFALGAGQTVVDWTCAPWLPLCFHLSRAAGLAKTLIVLLVPWAIFAGGLPPLVSQGLRELGVHVAALSSRHAVVREVLAGIGKVSGGGGGGGVGGISNTLTNAVAGAAAVSAAAAIAGGAGGGTAAAPPAHNTSTSTSGSGSGNSNTLSGGGGGSNSGWEGEVGAGATTTAATNPSIGGQSTGSSPPYNGGAVRRRGGRI